MPIKIPADLPATETLHKENIFVMTESRATTQDIRPLKILLLNLMPTKIATETQLARLLGNSPLQVDMEFLQTASHTPKNTSAEHMISFYKHFEDVKDNKYDGLIITGAPVEQMPFEEVDYWKELTEKARQICAGWEENEWVRRIVLEMISLLDSDDAERRRIALEVEKEMEAAEQKMNAA